MFRFCGMTMFVCVFFMGCGGEADVASNAEGVGNRLVPTREADGASVTERYGQLVVREGQYDSVADAKPWSGWWYPIKDDYLFTKKNGRLSPLEKLDQYIKASGRTDVPMNAADYERDHLYDPMAGNWEGLCDAWAAAAVSEGEPVRSVLENGVLFEVGDLKALLTKTYEQVEGAERFGQRYNGNRTSVFEDMYPDQFHRFVQVELFEKKRPFIMDKDPSVPVWNTPIWRAQLTLTKDSADPQLMHVHAWFSGTSPFVPSHDYVGTLSVSFEYTYDLVGITEPDGALKVLFGMWTGDSMDYHPDFVSTVSDRHSRKSKNPAIPVDVVNALIAKSRVAQGQ